MPETAWVWIEIPNRISLVAPSPRLVFCLQNQPGVHPPGIDIPWWRSFRLYRAATQIFIITSPHHIILHLDWQPARVLRTLQIVFPIFYPHAHRARWIWRGRNEFK